MQAHTMTFDTFFDKHVAIDYIKEHIEPDNEDECLTELRYIFFTGCELTKQQSALLREHCVFTSYEARDF
jgi:hypothetical protein